MNIPQRNKAASKEVRVLQDEANKAKMDEIQNLLREQYGLVSYAKIYNILEDLALDQLLEMAKMEQVSTPQ